MTVSNQILKVYAGDFVEPEITVIDASGAAVDISQSTDIVWNAKDESGNVVIERHLGAGGIVFSATGTDGKFKVVLASGDTANLCGRQGMSYAMQAEVFDASNNQETVMTGTLMVLAH